MDISEIDFDSSKFIINNIFFNESANLFASIIGYKNSDIILDNFEISIKNIKIIDIIYGSENTKLLLEFMKTDNTTYNYIKKIDSVIVKKVFDDRHKLFGEDIKFDIIDNIYRKCINLPNNVNDAPFIEAFAIGNYTKIFDKNENIIEINDLKKNNIIQANIIFDSITYSVNKYKANIIIKEMQIKRNIASDDTSLFCSESEHDEIHFAN
jgi:hypothetical protein